jgi:crotonobetainyl-CoA:carnitine CoA-transferase CaiB-like acyl-CoA transferase
MPAPLLGQHTAEVLDELGLSRAQIDTLFARNVVYDSTRG